jgi:energy-coupling factor transporter ATP-binding protein EcfA2
VKPTSIICLGPPNTGKSTLMSTVAKIVPPERVKLITLRAKESSSWGYQKYGLADSGSVIIDDEWRPDLGMFKATGYRNLLQELVNLYRSDKYDAVIVDPLTDAFDLASHDILAQDKVATPKDLDGKNASLAYYGAMRKKSVNIVRDLAMLTVGPHPKWVLTAIHTQPVAEENIVKSNKQHSDARARGARFEGDVLPQMEGGYKYDMVGEFALKLYTRVKTSPSKLPEYLVQVTADSRRFAGLGVAPALESKHLPNDLAEIIKAIEGAND